MADHQKTIESPDCLARKSFAEWCKFRGALPGMPHVEICEEVWIAAWNAAIEAAMLKTPGGRICDPQAVADNLQRGLTLASLCDMVLGEDACDRSDDALMRGVRRLLGPKDPGAAKSSAAATDRKGDYGKY